MLFVRTLDISMRLKQHLISQFNALRVGQRWDEAQEMLNQLIKLFPNDQEVGQIQADFQGERSCYDTVLCEQA